GGRRQRSGAYTGWWGSREGSWRRGTGCGAVPVGPYTATSAVRISGLATTFLALYARGGGTFLWGSARAVPESRGYVHVGLRTGQDGGDLLRRGLDAALQRRADHSLRGHPATAARQHWASGRRNPGATRACFHSRLNR